MNSGIYRPYYEKQRPQASPKDPPQTPPYPPLPPPKPPKKAKKPQKWCLVLYQPLKSPFRFEKTVFCNITLLANFLLNFYRPLRQRSISTEKKSEQGGTSPPIRVTGRFRASTGPILHLGQGVYVKALLYRSLFPVGRPKMAIFDPFLAFFDPF